jgi:[ribosomal protein S18]-alanine N-acetyltransferase
MSVRVRVAAAGDAEAMARLHADGFDPPWTVADFRGWLARPDAIAIVVDMDAVVACFALALEAGEDVEILTIVTARGVRGSGLAGAAFAAMDAEALRRGRARWVLEVAEDNAAARALYRRLGFGLVGRRKGYYPRAAGAVDAEVMARPVGPDLRA